MPLYTADVESLKKELVDLRRFNSFYGYEQEELKLAEYVTKKYSLSQRVSSYLDLFDKEQLKDIYCFEEAIEDHSMTLDEADQVDMEDEAENAIIKQVSEENYFNAPELELIFDQVEFASFHDVDVFPKMAVDPECPQGLKELDKIFTYEIARVKEQKSTLANVVLIQKLTKVQEKIRNQKLNEASVLISRFYTDNKQDVTVGYLYSEVLFAKASLGNQKSLSKAREVANNVCFLTDKSDDELISYYRYLYVCREFLYDRARALQLFREFVLIDPDKYTAPTVLTQRNGFYLKCLMLFLRFNVKEWGPYEVETMHAISARSIAGGVFYIAFLRKEILPHLDSVKLEKFIQIEIALHSIKDSHAKLMQKIQSNFDRDGLPKTGSKQIGTIGQTYLKNFFCAAKIPTFSDYLVNTSVSGVQYVSYTKNDRYLGSLGMSEHSFWRAWVSKITPETSLQRADIIPIEQVMKESRLLSKYESLINKAYEYEIEIYGKEEYKDAKALLSDITSTGIVKIIIGANKYSVFDYGIAWSALKEYYSNVKLAHSNINCQLASDLLLQKGKVGMFWNLEEIQMMVEALNLMIDSKKLGLKARLDAILEMKDEQNVDDQYMTLSEHLEMYWWLYILMISMLIFFFNVVL